MIARDLATALASPLPPPGADLDDLVRAWRAARDDALAAYGAWSASPPGGAADAYAVYVAAEAREAVAADVLGRWAVGRAR
jgi:hypothetical protein